MKFSSVQLFALAAAFASANPLMPRDEVCYFEGGGPVGAADAKCSGSNAKDHEDILTCPDPGVAERICGRDDVNGEVRDNCKAITGGGTYCTVGGVLPNNGHHFCWCVNGNFCCTQNAEVPGGDHPVDYLKSEGCSCGKEI